MSIIVRATQRLRQPGDRNPQAPAAWDPLGAPETAGPEGADPDPQPDLGFDPVVRSADGPDEAERNARPPTFTVDFTALKHAGFLDPDTRKSRLAEELRLIKRRLLREIAAARSENALAERPENAVLVTSAHSGEGKTFTALNLAFSIAMDERRRVVLIDGDPIKRSVSRRLGLLDRPGLTDALRNERRPVAWGDPLGCLLDCDQLPLSVLPAGTAQSSATDLFGGERMTTLIARAASRVGDGLVIVDAPPILAMSEPLALAHQVGRVIMVVAAGQTARSTVGAALDRLDLDDRVSLVLNRQPPHLSPTETDY